MPDVVVPESAKLAAKRAFVRTTAQGYATSITGALVLAIVGLLKDTTNWVDVVILVLVALFTPLAAGLASYFQWLRAGIPVEYEVAAVEQRLDRFSGGDAVDPLAE